MSKLKRQFSIVKIIALIFLNPIDGLSQDIYPERDSVTNTTISPYNEIVQIVTWRKGLKRIFSGKKSFIETGFFIAPNIILTVGHNMKSDILSKIKSIIVTPARNGNVKPYGQITIGKKEIKKVIRFPKDYKWRTDDECYEFAVLILDDKLKFDYFNLKEWPTPNHYMGKEINITGYPAEENHQKNKYHPEYKNGIGQWYQKGVITKVDSCTFEYKEITTEGGNSGSPIWIEEAGELYVIGIHEGKASSHSPPRAVKLDNRVIKQIEDWTKMKFR
ncbi:MAG: trypsin-like serine protease [Saprospiraceae bacterium]|jgi:V8-like Glu-specific endopeptidase|nr:trypsin-like serine protease [Saprospiraceae bacterium]